jgi:hypothetical protein
MLKKLGLAVGLMILGISPAFSYYHHFYHYNNYGSGYYNNDGFSPFIMVLWVVIIIITRFRSFKSKKNNFKPHQQAYLHKHKSPSTEPSQEDSQNQQKDQSPVQRAK